MHTHTHTHSKSIYLSYFCAVAVYLCRATSLHHLSRTLHDRRTLILIMCMEDMNKIYTVWQLGMICSASEINWHTIRSARARFTFRSALVVFTRSTGATERFRVTDVLGVVHVAVSGAVNVFAGKADTAMPPFANVCHSCSPLIRYPCCLRIFCL